MNIHLQLYQLFNITNEKIKCLESVYELTDKQTQYLSLQQVDKFLLLCDEKQRVIEKINKLDDQFNSIYESIKNEMMGSSSKVKEYSEEIKKLQMDIMQIQKAEERIMHAEAKNKIEYKKIFEKMKNVVKKSAPVSRNYIEQYKKIDQLKKKKD